MSEQQARRAYLEILYNNKDISADISKDLDSFTWTDKASKEADELSIKLQNTHGKWTGEWLASKGAKLTATIVTENWSGDEGIKKLPCGTFEIDEISSSGGQKSQTEIKSVSVPITSSSRGQSRTRAWENVKLSCIANDIAGKAGLEFLFDSQSDPEYQREDQMEESDMGFLLGLCEDAGLSLKVSHDKLIIFSEQEYAKKDAVLTLTPEDLTSWKITSKSSKIYKSCRVKYHDPEDDEDYEYEAQSDSPEIGEEDKNDRTLEVNQRCKSRAEAESLAKNKLFNANKGEVTMTFSMAGNMKVVAGVNLNIQGFGAFDGKYSIDSATHNVGGGYTTEANIGLKEKKKGKNSGGASYTNWSEFDHLGKDYG